MHEHQLTPEEKRVFDLRQYPFHPHVGVGGVILWTDSVLLIQRKFNPDAGKWSIPGGHLEIGETLAEGARRECEEETNLKLVIQDQTRTYDKIVRDKEGKVEYHYVLVDFLMVPLGNFSILHPPQPVPSSDVLQAQFVKLKDLKQYDLPDTVKELFNDLGYI